DLRAVRRPDWFTRIIGALDPLGFKGGKWPNPKPACIGVTRSESNTRSIRRHYGAVVCSSQTGQEDPDDRRVGRSPQSVLSKSGCCQSAKRGRDPRNTSAYAFPRNCRSHPCCLRNPFQCFNEIARGLPPRLRILGQAALKKAIEGRRGKRVECRW